MIKDLTRPSCILCGTSRLEIRIPSGVLPDKVSVLRCRVCDLTFLGSLQQDEAFDPEEAAYWDNDEQKKIYLSEGIQKLFVAEFENRLERLENLSKGCGTLLDIGCGVGHFLQTARRRGWAVRGLDISQAASRVARQTYDIDVMVGTLETASFGAGEFDAVTLWDAIEHIRRPIENLKAANRFLRPGGVLAMKTPNESSLFKQCALAAYRAFGRKASFLLKYVYYVPHYFSYSEKSMNQLLAHCGFQALRYEIDETPQEFAEEKINLHYQKDPKRSAVIAFLPIARLMARVLGRGNKMVIYAKKVQEVGPS